MCREQAIYAVVGLSVTLMIAGVETSAAGMTLVANDSAQAVIVISPNPGRLEALAASELSRYIKEMTGVAVPVVAAKDKSVKDQTNLILLGRPDTNSSIEKLAQEKLLKLSSDFPGSDGFVIKTITAENKNYLVLGGSTDRGTLYAVYHFLENICRVGFFWDGERVPSIRALSVGETDIVEKPYFPERSAMVSSYAWVYWNTPDWKREVDWLAKKKFNMSWGLVRPALEKIALYEVFSDFGVKGVRKEKLELERKLGLVINDLDKVKQYQVEMAKEVLDYARSRGLDLVYEAFAGDVPEEFIKKYPKARYFKSKWCGYVTGYLHPADPLFTKISSAYIRKQREMFGPSRLYYISPYPEVSPGADRQEKDELQLSFAKSVIDGIKKVVPKGRWFCSDWAFTAVRKTWDNRALKRFLDSIPNDSFLVWDVWAEMHPLYKWTDYFFGKDWAFGIIHSFGGNVGIFGDVKDLIKRVRDVAFDPKAKNCKQFIWEPEGIPYNSMYLDLVTKLAWDPRKINLESYLVDFAARRYGDKSVGNMVKCWQELVESVHSTNRYNDALYQRRLGTFPASLYATFQRSNFVPDFTERLPYIKHLKKALEYALLEKDKQADNKLYRHDLVDITKQYLGELFNYHLLQLYRAFAKGERVKFENEAKTIGRIMDDLEKIVSTRDDYQLEPFITKSLKMPGVKPDTAKRIRDFVTGFNAYEGIWSHWDYNAKDYFEVIKYYYRKRVDFYLDTLRKKLQTHQTKLDCEKELTPAYRRITLDFINNDLQVAQDRYKGNSAQAATAIFATWKDISSLDLTPLFGREVKFGSKVVWQDDFSKGDNWKSLSGKGIFASDGKVLTMKSVKGRFTYDFNFPEPIDLSRGLVIGFRAQLVGSMERLSSVSVIWTDSDGRTRETYLYPTSEMWATGEWQEYRVDLSGLLTLLGELEKVKPVALKTIRITNRPFPCEVRWDWMKITAND